jgi:uncharacterized membrane protein
MDTINEQITLQEDEFINKLHVIVSDTIQEEDLIINNLLHPPKEILSKGQKLSDRIARFGGSWKFIILFLVIIFIWIGYNIIAVGKKEFDPYPFILMNLLLSCMAALQAPVIMMSQNRQEEKDRMQNENDYLINLKSEVGIRGLHQKLDLLLGEQIKSLYDIQAKQLSILEEIKLKVQQKNDESESRF